MLLKPFLLDIWLAAHEHSAEYNLGGNTGPVWTLDQLLALGSEEDRQRFLHHPISYGRPAGDNDLRAAIAPGDCFDLPSDFRLGFGATGDRFPPGLERFAEFLTTWEKKIAIV